MLQTRTMSSKKTSTLSLKIPTLQKERRRNRATPRRS
jgi:hypothetical protein